jgi:hypothetical protein
MLESLPLITLNENATVGAGPISLEINADSALDSMLPIDGSYVNTTSTYSTTSSAQQTCKYSAADRRFEMARLFDGLVGVGGAINMSVLGGTMTWMTP